MTTEEKLLKNWIVTQFENGAGVSAAEAESDMDAIWTSFAHAAGVPPKQIPENELSRLRIFFNEEWSNAYAEEHSKHALFVKSLAEKVATRAKLR